MPGHYDQTNLIIKINYLLKLNFQYSNNPEPTGARQRKLNNVYWDDIGPGSWKNVEKEQEKMTNKSGITSLDNSQKITIWWKKSN